MKNVIIGTAGHIDHGKTTLIKALTGRATDTLKDEIQRGISINLGFTYFDLPSGKRAGIIDVPGHEKFIKNMIAGAYGIDIVMLTISATEGIKPQTIEHVEIISRLDIKEGVIVLTKCDLVEDELLPLIKEEIEEGLKGTFFEDKEFVEIDSVSGRGINNLVSTIDRLTDTVKTKSINALTRLNVDRVFTFKGFGTIVTGTLSEGTVSVGDELVLYPSEIKTRVRNIQVHEKDAEKAYAGQRTALNLANVKVEDIHRGHILAKADSLIKTNIIDVRVTYSKKIENPLLMWDRIRVYLGAGEYFARFVPLTDEGENYAQIRFEKEIWVRKGDLFVIRRYSPMEVCGGGIILDPQAKKHRHIDEKMLNALEVYKEGSDYDIVEEFLRGKKDTFKISHISTGVSKSIEDTTKILLELVNNQTVIKVNEFFFHAEDFEQITENIIAVISDYHNKFTLRTGIPKEELRNKVELKLKLKDFDEILKILIQDGMIKILGSNVSVKNFKPQYTKEQQRIKDTIEKRIYESGFTPPAITEIAKDLKGYSYVLESLLNDTLIRIDKDIFIHADYLEKAKEIVQGEIIGNGEITLAVFRDRTNSSRKYGMLILDYLDSIKFTKRVEDKRILC